MTKALEAPVAEQKTVTYPRLGEWIITLSMLAFFAAAYLIAEDFPIRAALFPRMVSVLGLALSLLRIVGLVRETVRGTRARLSLPAVASAPTAVVEHPPAAASPASPDTRGEPVEAVSAPSELAIVDDDVEDDASMEYVFASAGTRAWLEAMSWIVVFFIAFFTLGAFLAVPLFALLYLRLSGNTSWSAAAVYALVTGSLIYVAFRRLVYIPLPTGLLPFLQL